MRYSLKEILELGEQGGFAVHAFNMYNFEKPYFLILCLLKFHRTFLRYIQNLLQYLNFYQLEYNILTSKYTNI